MDIWYSCPVSHQHNTYFRKLDSAGIPYRKIGYSWNGRRIMFVVDSQYEQQMKTLGFPKSRDHNKASKR